MTQRQVFKTVVRNIETYRYFTSIDAHGKVEDFSCRYCGVTCRIIGREGDRIVAHGEIKWVSCNHCNSAHVISRDIETEMIFKSIDEWRSQEERYAKYAELGFTREQLRELFSR